MIAFVLSGGGSQGALQAGALQALVEQGITPDIVIGASVGAINGAYLALDPSPANLERLAETWRQLSSDEIYPGSYATALWRLLRRGQGLYSNEPLRAYLANQMPAGVRTFADLRPVRFYAIATQTPQGRMHIFGQEPGESLLDGVMASVALPPFHPPYQVGEQFYLDGSLSANLPLKIAAQLGATTIYALHIYNDLAEETFERGAFSVSTWAILKLLHNQTQAELEWAENQPQLAVHHLTLTAGPAHLANDFSRGPEFIQTGYRQTQAYLKKLPEPIPLSRPAPLKERLRDWTHPLRQAITPPWPAKDLS